MHMIEKLQSMGRERVIAKRSYLFRQGESATSLYVVLDGLLKAFYETRDGKQFIKSFVKQGGFIASIRAIVHNEPSSFSTVCLEDSRLVEIPRSEFMRAVDSDPELLRALNSMLVKVASTKELREYELLCLSAEERYAAFCEREPDLLKRIFQEDIARYLGITPVSLCRIRKKHQHPTS